MLGVRCAGRIAAFGMLVVVTVGGCGRDEPPAAGGDPNAAAPESTALPVDVPSGAASAAEVDLRIVTPEQFHETLEELRGQVVLVDFWATWCTPCIAQFPHTVELSRQHRDAGLAVVSMSLDYPEDRERVLQFLKRQGAEFDNLLSAVGGGAEAFEKLDLEALPQYRLYDRAGQVQLDFSGNPSDHDLDARIAELIAQP